MAEIGRDLPRSTWGGRYRAIPYWYGDDESVPPFLGASIEPPGLQVYGVLPLADWAAWDEGLRLAAVELPVRASR